MKKIIFISLFAIIVSVSLIFIFLNKKEEKFYLEDKYYGKNNLNTIDSENLKKLEEKKENFIVYVH